MHKEDHNTPEVKQNTLKKKIFFNLAVQNREQIFKESFLFKQETLFYHNKQ